MSQPAKTGEYTVSFYNGYGTKLRDLKDKSGCLTAAQALGDARLLELKEDGNLDTPHSFTIDRRIFNSLDGKTKF